MECEASLDSICPFLSLSSLCCHKKLFNVRALCSAALPDLSWCCPSCQQSLTRPDITMVLSDWWPVAKLLLISGHRESETLDTKLCYLVEVLNKKPAPQEQELQLECSQHGFGHGSVYLLRGFTLAQPSETTFRATFSLLGPTKTLPNSLPGIFSKV